jgi:diguanylate cyclase (GGDEF)-like protein/PAS domain S-box-containing protein
MSATLRKGPTTLRTHLGQILGVVGALAVLVVHVIWPAGVTGQVTYLLFTGGGAVVAMVAGRRLTGDAGRPWRWIALGLISSALADLYWGIHSLVGPVPDVSLADPLWLASYGFLIAGLFGLLRNTGDGIRDDLEALVDTLATLVVSVLVLWQLVVSPVLDDTSTDLVTRLVWASYPALDAILLALVFRAVIGGRTSTTVGRLLVAGIALWLLADLGSNFWEWAGPTGILLDTGWMVGPALLGLATWVAAHHPTNLHATAQRPRALPARIGPLRVAMAVSPLLVPTGLELWANRFGTGVPAILAVGTLSLTLLVGARLMLFLRTRDEAERRLESSERYYRALAANSADAVLVIDATGQVQSESPHLAALLGHPGQSIRGIQGLEVVCLEDAPSANALFNRTLASPGTIIEGELRLQAADGSTPWLAVRAVNLLEDPDVAGIVVNFHEITDRKVAEEELVHLAFHDSLTGLANRALFHDRVDHVLETGGGAAAAVAFLDLDGFKNVNDGLGHDGGDQLLRQVADRLLASARPGDTVARLGGDEFAILLENCPDPRASAIAVADRILAELLAPMVLAGGLMTLSASIGIALPSPGATASCLLRDADVAMYEAKAAGRGRWVEYTPRMRTATLQRLQLNQDLAEALDGDQLKVVYQPVVELSTGSIVGFEALLRWDHPTLGRISPDRFIPLAEESGLIIPIGRWVLETACHRAVDWQSRHPLHRELTMAVNISARQLASSDLVSHVEDALASSGLAARFLVLEMTESVLVEDAVTAAARLRQLRRLGMRLAVDDFGTGYSSLSYLRQFPIDVLKVDQSFVTTITDRDGIPPLVHGLLALGHTLELEMVAEGIETWAQLSHLRAEGCPRGQGYLFSPPVPAGQADALLAAGRLATEPVSDSYASAAS